MYGSASVWECECVSVLVLMYGSVLVYGSISVSFKLLVGRRMCLAKLSNLKNANTTMSNLYVTPYIVKIGVSVDKDTTILFWYC